MYEWIKALHVISVIAWMAGMLYLPRLFVYHCEAEIGSKQSETFKVMERRLLKGIINPAMMVAWIAGLWLMWQGGWYVSHWFHVKFALVFACPACTASSPAGCAPSPTTPTPTARNSIALSMKCRRW